MLINLTVKFDEDEIMYKEAFYAKLADLKMKYSDGDADGRRWVQITGYAEPGALDSLLSEMRRSRSDSDS